MVMPLLEGRPLSDFMTAPLSILRSLDIAIQILRGLEHAHARGIIHRDLEPGNAVVLGDDNCGQRVVLADFGLAKFVSAAAEGAASTLSGLICGTPGYMSPEQALGMPTDGRADVYSAGIIFYRMLTGCPPFAETDASALLHCHMTQEIPALPPAIPRALADIVGMMVRKDREERMRTATAALRSLLELRGEANVPRNPIPEPPPWGSGPRVLGSDMEPTPTPSLDDTATLAPTTAGLSTPRLRLLQRSSAPARGLITVLASVLTIGAVGVWALEGAPVDGDLAPLLVPEPGVDAMPLPPEPTPAAASEEAERMLEMAEPVEDEDEPLADAAVLGHGSEPDQALDVPPAIDRAAESRASHAAQRKSPARVSRARSLPPLPEPPSSGLPSLTELPAHASDEWVDPTALPPAPTSLQPGTPTVDPFRGKHRTPPESGPWATNRGEIKNPFE
jgi:serine/threonine-protein kinase